jgi:peptidoglycan/xylan/chitin deacetylase (PgdA/CDA1 family)
MEIAKQAKIAGGRIARRFARKSVILMYHRISAPNVDPWALCVTPRHFAEHLQVLKEAFTVVSVRDLGLALQHRRLTDRTVAISFDDGYADNLHNAEPLLDAFGLPATIFMTTGSLARSREFWWDELEQVLLHDRQLPETLTLTTKAGKRSWRVPSEPHRRESRVVKAWEGAPGSRMALFHEIWESMLRLPSEEQNSVLDQLKSVPEQRPSLRPSHRALTAQEIQKLARNELIDIGAHTVNHPLLTAHSETFQRREIESNKSQLEELTGTEINCFAYPFGDYDTTTTSLTREAGFECACTTVENTVWRFSDPFRMPRLAVDDWDGDQFAKRLHGILR